MIRFVKDKSYSIMDAAHNRANLLCAQLWWSSRIGRFLRCVTFHDRLQG